jgi:hypothetical protein
MGKRHFKLLCILLLVFLISCESKETLTLGSGFIQPTANIVLTDTMTVSTSTLLLDTLVTSGKNIALVGRYSNDIIGSIKSRSYIILRNASSSVDEESIYDSLVLTLVPSGYYYGDTNTFFTISVNRVLQDIEFNESESYLYNNSHFDFDSTENLGEKTFNPRPNEKEEIRIHLSDQLGLTFLNKLKANSNAFEEDGGFINYFKGIVLNSRSAYNKSILGFSTDSSILLSLYYHISESDDVKSVKFNPASTDLQFNEIISNRSNTLIQDISETPTSSSELENYSFVQGGLGLVTRIEFPTLRNLLEQDKPFEIIKAQLVVQPSTMMEVDYLPQTLNLYATNKHNEFLGALTDEEGTTLNGSLYIDYVYRENINYSWDITAYIKNLTGLNPSEYNGLLLLPENYNTSFEHVIIADQKKSHYRTFLKLHLFYYE